MRDGVRCERYEFVRGKQWRMGSAIAECITYNVYYTENFLRAQFPGAVIRRPVNQEMQHCCIIGRG
jgi:hypothetical protein